MKKEDNLFKKKAATRIALISLLLAALVAPLAWYVEKEGSEAAVVSLATEESKRLLLHVDAIDLAGSDAPIKARLAAHALTGGLFEIVEIYGPAGNKLAEAATALGGSIEKDIPKHGRPAYTSAAYENLTLPSGQWGIRVFVPLRLSRSGNNITGYFEGVRIIPAWQKGEIDATALKMALIAALAALFCGGGIYPIVVLLSAENNRKTLEVLDSHISMMEALGRAIARRDSDTGAHNYRVAWIAARIGEEMGVSGANMQSLIAGSFLHDVGKIGIPDAILLKPGRLDEQEMTIMRSHVDLGEQIVTGMGWLDGANEVVAAHHEKWNGSGYPRKLAGSEIPLAARIFAIADVFDALSSKRPYKEPLPFEQVMSILAKDTGSHFDPAVMKVFEHIAEEVRTNIAEGLESNARRLLEEIIRKHFVM